jgi:hypothetical protein
MWVARRALRQNRDDVGAVDADASDPIPAVVIDEDAPLGATSDSHDELIPEDLPRDHPGRPEVKRRFEAQRSQAAKK